jgi:hypothetical protein
MMTVPDVVVAWDTGRMSLCRHRGGWCDDIIHLQHFNNYILRKYTVKFCLLSNVLIEYFHEYMSYHEA